MNMFVPRGGRREAQFRFNFQQSAEPNVKRGVTVTKGLGLLSFAQCRPSSLSAEKT